MQEPDHGTAHAAFQNRDAVADYARGPRMQVPGHDGLLVMTDLLLAEHVPAQGRLFVIGAGGGLELTHLARNHPGWHFTGVDPSAPMLDLAVQAMGPMAARADMILGTADMAPPGPFDGAVCLLTLHFVQPADRLPTLRAIHARLAPGAPFVCAHYSVPGDAAERAEWFARQAAFAGASGLDPDKARANATRVSQMLPILSPDQDAALLAEAGFDRVQQFYAGLTFRGWVCRAG